LFHEERSFHVPCSASRSPTGYRFGFGSPTRLVHLGFAGGASASGSVEACGASLLGEDGVLTFVSVVSTASSTFFLRLRFGREVGEASPASAWITLLDSCSGGGASTFLRTRVFMTGGGGAASTFATGVSDTGSVPPDGCGVLKARAADISGGVSRGGSGGTGEISSPPCNSRHTCSRLLAVWFKLCSPS
jgi:hypothetical protein